MSPSAGVEYRVHGDPDGGPTFELDHERFAYAGKFVVGGTGKAVARTGETVLGAAAFDRDRTDDAVVRIRYVTVRRDRQGEGIGAQLLAVLVDHLLGERADVDAVKIAVNNAFAYQAAYKAGFGYTGEHTGLAELVLVSPRERAEAIYVEGLEALRDRDGVSDRERRYLSGLDGEPPAPVAPSNEP